MGRKDRAMGVIWILLGVIISIWSATFPFGGMEEPGPAYLPLACGLIIGVLGAVLFLRPANQNQDETGKHAKPIFPRGSAGRRVALTIAGMGFCATFMNILGFFLTVFFMILFLMRSVGPVKWKTALFCAILYSVASFFIFKVLLKTQLPVGILWI